MEKATFAAGCFWGVQEAFDALSAVRESIVGYTGGSMANPCYEDVLTDTTGHAEALQLSYDPREISYEQLLVCFFELHNPSTMPGSRYKYRSSIFYHNKEQQKISLSFLEALKKARLYPFTIKTTVVKAEIFYKAEAYHQHYYSRQKRR